MQTRDEVEGLHNCLEFSQPLSCLHQVIQTRKTFSFVQTVLVKLRFKTYSKSSKRRKAISPDYPIIIDIPLVQCKFQLFISKIWYLKLTYMSLMANLTRDSASESQIKRASPCYPLLTIVHRSTPCILLKSDRLKSSTISVNNNNTELYLVTYVVGFTLLESVGRPESASLFSSPRLEATCRSFNVFVSDEGMIEDFNQLLSQGKVWKKQNLTILLTLMAAIFKIDGMTSFSYC